MNPDFDAFLKEFIPAVESKVINITEFGSDKGKEHPELSDIDLFIIAKNKSHRDYIFKQARNFELKHLKTRHSKITNLLQKYLFLSNDFTGLHLLIIGQEEIDNNFVPKSFRIKFLTSTCVSRAILFNNIKQQHNLLFGQDLAQLITPPRVGLQDRIVAIIFPILVLLPISLAIFNRDKFNIWCFKILKYHSDIILEYSKLFYNNPNLTIHSLKVNSSMIDLAAHYRYSPETFRGNRILLYLKTWACILSNIKFIWTDPILKN